jgi:hypothetical protein
VSEIGLELCTVVAFGVSGLEPSCPISRDVFFIWFVRLLALRPLLANWASLG